MEGALERRILAIPTTKGRLFELLLQRKTVRLFDPDNPMTEEELTTVLYYTFGCQGYKSLLPGVVGLHKTSPSGGALHPVEVYPLLLRACGVAAGLYHYDVERHSLDLLRPLDRAEAEDLAERFTMGQAYFRSAHVLFLLTARFYRTFWKYRRDPKAYRVIHLDAGHLSQTLYLIAGELGLGAFFTGAVNDINIEEVLGIDGLEQGVIGILGCGRPWKGGSPLGFEPEPYIPHKTKIE